MMPNSSINTVDESNYTVQDETLNEEISLLHNTRTRQATKCIKIFCAAILVCLLLSGTIIGVYLLITEDGSSPFTTTIFYKNTTNWRNNPELLVSYKLQLPVEKIIFINATCISKSKCLEDYHILNESIIPYNFILEENGQLHEGCGWNNVPAIFDNIDNRTILVAFLGSTNNFIPTNLQISKIQMFIDIAQTENKISKCYVIIVPNYNSQGDKSLTDLALFLSNKNQNC